MYQIGKTFEFAAAQRLDGMPPGHPCGNLHGHTYTVTAILESDTLDDRGMVLDYGDLAPIAADVKCNLDHGYLNEALSVNPTAENIARWLYERWHKMLPQLAAVRVCESPRTFAEYRP